VRGASDDPDAAAALGGFERFPAWMWRNADILDFVGRLRAHDERADVPAGFYGLDVYSLHRSIERVLAYLDRVDPEAARRARWRYGCFEDKAEDPEAYGFAARFGLGKSCEDEAVAQLVEQIAHRRRGDGDLDAFDAEQNARVVAGAEAYYRAMFGRRISSWNLRDTHMVDTLDALAAQLERRTGRPAKIVVWAHNSHLGDARATEMGDQGELNLGQLVRERHAGETYAIGFSTYGGSVTAASEWDAPAERKHVRPGLARSWEHVFHHARIPRFVVFPSDLVDAGADAPRLQRAIGVIYRPESERVSHYDHVRLPDQFDAVIHLDQTRAVEPLEPIALPPPEELAEPPETFPSGV
jgi:erythromycin esterase-like protein